MVVQRSHDQSPSLGVGYFYFYAQPEEGPAPGIFGKLLAPASVPPIHTVNLSLPSRLPVAVNAAPGIAFSAVAWSLWRAFALLRCKDREAWWYWRLAP
jgi:hypothetical protein